MPALSGRLFLACQTAWILIALMANESQAQAPLEKMKFYQLDVNQGLSNSHIICIHQDSKGFLWVGTNDGLNRYDGYSFKTYRQVPGDTSGLYNNAVNSIYEDRDGKIWISTFNRGFYFYDRKKDKINVIPELSALGEIYNISEDRYATLWITGVMHSQAFAASLNRKTQQWERHALLSSDEAIIGMHAISKNEYIFSSRLSGLFKWNRETKKVVRYTMEGQPKFIHKSVMDNNGNIWIAARTGVYKFDSRTEVLTRISHDPKKPIYTPSVDVIRDIVVDGNQLWIGTENGGLNRMDIATGRFTHYMNKKNDPWSFSDNSVWAVYKDHQGRIWGGTFSKGLCYYDNRKDKFGELNIELENDVVNAVVRDSKGRIWVGTEGGLVMLDGETTNNFFAKDDATGKPAVPFLNAFEDSRHRMWFGTWESGLLRFDDNTKEFIQYLPDTKRKSSLADSRVYCVNEQADSKKILVCTYHGLDVLVDEERGEFIHYVDSVHEPNNYKRVIYEDRVRNLWVGSISTLDQLDSSFNLKSSYFFDEATGDGHYVYCIAEAGKDLWVGANKGLYRLQNNKIVEFFTTRDGLANNIINSILVDNHGILWLSTSAGVSRFDPKTKRFTNYDVSDGLISNQFKPNAGFKSKDGYFFFGGKGVNIFHPDSIKTNPIIPQVYITGLRILNKEIGVGDSILRDQISELKEITLEPEYNFFTLEYVALNLTASNRNQFAYKLENFNNDWIEVGTQRFATFTNLDPGRYTFRVKASNNDGVWNETGASIVVNILPPWYKTWWFYTLVVFLVIATTIIISLIRTRNIRRVNQRLERTVKQKTRKLQQTNSALVRQDTEITSQNRKLTEQREELATQNEELIQTQEEIASQRDILALQNKNLSEAQAIINKQNQDIISQNENLEIEVLKRTQELVDYNHQLEQFAFAAAHSLRGPVARILGLGQLLDLTQKNHAEKEEIYPKLVHTTKELDTVVKDLNAILELNMNHNAFVSEMQLGEEMALVCENLEPEIKATNATINSDFRQVSTIRTVKKYLDSILFHLINNAIKYRHPDRPPAIVIKTERNENEICITVSDNGLGIDMAQFGGKIFSMYRRFHTHVEGKGIGLYLVKTQVEALGGRIEVESEVEVGSTFRVYLKDRRAG